MQWQCVTFPRSLEDLTLFEVSPLESETRLDMNSLFLDDDQPFVAYEYFGLLGVNKAGINQ